MSNGLYVIINLENNTYWKVNDCGYTDKVSEAKVFDKKGADLITKYSAVKTLRSIKLIDVEI